MKNNRGDTHASSATRSGALAIAVRAALYGSLLLPAMAVAEDYCVANVEELVDALAQAQASAESDRIMIVRGEYELDDTLSHSAQLDGNGQPAPTGELQVQGGAEPGCQTRRPGAQWTTLRFAPLPAPDNRGVGFSTLGGDLEVSDLGIFEAPAGAHMNAGAGSRIRVRRVAVVNETTQPYDGLTAFTASGDVRFDSVLVDSTAQTCSAAIASFSNIGVVEFVNSTIINRSDAVAVCFDGAATTNVNAAWNSILHSVDGPDFAAFGTSALLVGSVFEEDYVSCAPDCGDFPVIHPSSSENVFGTVTFVGGDDPLTASTPRRIAGGNPAIDSGLEYPVTPDDPLSAYDLLGALRFVGSAIDRGAIEVAADDTLVFCDGFESSGFACS